MGRTEIQSPFLLDELVAPNVPGGLGDRLKAPPYPHPPLLTCQADREVPIIRQQGLSTLMGYLNIT